MKRTVIYYVAIFILIMAFVQLILSAIEVRKIMLPERNGVLQHGIIVDKFIQERFQGPQTGYRLLFNNDTLNQFYNQRYFKSYSDKYNKGDTLTIYHYTDNPSLSRIANFRDAYSQVLANVAIALTLMLVAWIGMKKHNSIMKFIRWS